MRVYVLVSGLLRTFTESLFPFLCELNALHPIELIICTPSGAKDTKYNSYEGYNEQIKRVLSHQFSKICIIHNDECSPNIHRTQREKNTLAQWYHIESCLRNLISTQINEDDIVIRIRPDIRFEISPTIFLEAIYQATKTDGILIPSGNDIFNPAFLKYTTTTVNVQMAIGRYTYMKVYCSLWSETDFDTIPSPLISEAILWNYLQEKNVTIYRIDLPYTLCLSSCKIIAITGDSGVGKTTLTNALRLVFPYDSNLVLETDRYHKWERGAKEWEKMTHLNPAANFLEKLHDDTYMLKMGEQIQHVDYDHTVGKFTEVENIDSKKYMFLCGLHTLYSEEIRSDIDLKIYIDTEYFLKRFWKIRRDMVKRGYTFEHCRDIFNTRQSDYRQYILPQKNHADICIYYSSLQHIPEVYTVDTMEPPIHCQITCCQLYIKYVDVYLTQFSKGVIIEENGSRTYTLHEASQLSKGILLNSISEGYRRYIDSDKILPGYLGIFQILILLILINPVNSVNTA